MKKYINKIAAVLAVIIYTTSFVFSAANVSAVVPGNVTLISVNNTSTGAGNGVSGGGSYSRISADGNFVTFESMASDLVANDTNDTRDVFVRDLTNGLTQRVSVSTSGVQSNGISISESISETGRYVLFYSYATNLIDGQNLTSCRRAFLRDTLNNTTELVFPPHQGSGCVFTTDEISSDGRFVLVTRALQTSSKINSVYLYDRTADTMTPLDNPVSGEIQSNFGTTAGSLSCDGKSVVFSSAVSNLTENDTNGRRDIFLVDLSNGINITNITQAANGHSWDYPYISCNGRYISFVSTASNLVDGVTGTNTEHVYRYDRVDGSIVLADQSTSGNVANESSVYFSSAVSDTGHVVFASRATNLATGHKNRRQIYFRNTALNTTEILSVNSSLSASDQNVTALHGSISKDGRFAIFTASGESNLISGLANGNFDVMMAETGATDYDTVAPVLGEPNWSANPVAIGNYTSFMVSATDDVSGVEQGEYFIGTDPGAGNATTLSWDGSNFSSGDFGSDLPLGEHTIGIRARDNAGNWSEVTNATLTVIDPTAPVITYGLSHAVPPSGWYTEPITLTWALVELESAITSQTGCDITTLSSDTTGIDFTCSATSAGGTATETVNLKYDATMPILGTPTWTTNPVNVGNDTNFTVPATDATSGVEAGEYFIGTDPGEGNAAALAWDGTNLTSADFGANLAAGVYSIGIRAQDAAGNWSAILTTYLVVFDSAGPGYIVGQQNLKPGEGDTLPWISTDNKDFATFGFNVEFTPTGTVDSSSEFDFSYVEKGSCNNPNTPACRSFVLNATSFDWFAVGGTNNSEGTFQGTATLSIDEVTSTVLFRVEAVDGNRLTPTQPDSFVLKVYAENDDPQAATPLYQVSADFTPGSGNANGGVQVKN